MWSFLTSRIILSAAIFDLNIAVFGLCFGAASISFLGLL